MGVYDWVSAIFVAFSFVAWAVWGKFYNLHSALLGIMSTSLLALTVTLLSFSQFGDIGNKIFPSLKAFAVMIFLCGLNGVGFYIYSNRVSDPLVKTGSYIVVVSVLMLMEARFLDWYLNNNSLSFLNSICLVIIVLGIIGFVR